MTEYENKKAGRERFQIGSAKVASIMEHRMSIKEADLKVNDLSESLEIKTGSADEDLANKILSEFSEEKEAIEEGGEEGQEKEAGLTESQLNEFRKVGQLLAIDSISRHMTGEGIEKEAVRKKKSKSLALQRIKKGRLPWTPRAERGLLGKILKLPFKVTGKAIRFPFRHPLLALAMGGGLYGAKKLKERSAY
jgi:hypothetical protein